MLPGKKYRPEDIFQIVRKRFWVLLVPFAVISAGTAVVARYLPDTYKSTATLQVVPQRVPESFVKSSVVTPVEERLQAIRVTITSRTRLERIINEFNLYPAERRSGIMEDITDRMRRRDIEINVGTNGDFFTVSYIGSEPRTVMKVTEKLAGQFLDESTTDRKQQAEGTNVFLESQLEEVRHRLEEQDKILATYRQMHAQELPSQQASNLAQVQNAALQIQQLMEAVDKHQIRRASLEEQLQQLDRDPTQPNAEVVLPPTGAPGDLPVIQGTTAQQLAIAEAYYAQQKASGKGPNHWDMIRAEKLLKEARARAEADAYNRPLSGPTVLSKEEQLRQGRIATIRTELKLIDAAIAENLKKEQQARQVMNAYQSRAEAAPMRETELLKITRDYQTTSDQYRSLLQRKEEARIAANLEQRAIGEQFKLVDPASYPERPVSPDRPTINMMGMFVGFVVGIGLILLLEYRDASFKTDEEIIGLLTLPVLAVVPLMQSDADRRRNLRKRLIMGVGLGGAVVGCLAVLVYTFVR
jgi:polysaccharide chain length determinant protein (PEP-CTERM system associated)